MSLLQELEKRDSFVTLYPEVTDNLTYIGGLEGKRLDSLTAEEAAALRDTVISVSRLAENYNKLFKGARGAQATEAAKNVIAENKTEKIRRDGGPIDELLNYDMLNAFTFFDRTGDTMYGLFERLLDGRDTHVRNIRIAEKYMAILIGKTNIHAWTNKAAKGALKDILEEQFEIYYGSGDTKEKEAAERKIQSFIDNGVFEKSEVNSRAESYITERKNEKVKMMYKSWLEDKASVDTNQLTEKEREVFAKLRNDDIKKELDELYQLYKSTSLLEKSEVFRKRRDEIKERYSISNARFNEEMDKRDNSKAG